MSVHYKFKSGKEFNTITFDGAFIPLSELKQQIIIQKKLGKSSDFDLEVTNASSEQGLDLALTPLTFLVYTDDSTPIPKNASVIVRRIPTAKTNKVIETKIQTLRQPAINVKVTSSPVAEVQEQPVSPPPVTQTPSPEVEEEPMEEDLQAIENLVSESDTWRHGVSAPTGRHGRDGYSSHNSSEPKVPHSTYTCYRCGNPGHFINNCPTNGDDTFNFHVVRKSTGIPKTMLTPVSQAEASAAGTLLMPGGGFARMTPNEKAFEKERKALIANANGVPEHLQCPFCRKLVKDAVLIPCCGTSFCDKCIRPEDPTEEIECPLCKRRSLPKRLLPNQNLRRAANQYQKQQAEDQKKGEQEKPMVVAPTLPLQVKKEASDPIQETTAGSPGPSPKRYRTPSRSPEPSPKRYKTPSRTPSPNYEGAPTSGYSKRQALVCYTCGIPGHMAKDCPVAAAYYYSGMGYPGYPANYYSMLPQGYPPSSRSDRRSPSPPPRRRNRSRSPERSSKRRKVDDNPLMSKEEFEKMKKELAEKPSSDSSSDRKERDREDRRDRDRDRDRDRRDRDRDDRRDKERRDKDRDRDGGRDKERRDREKDRDRDGDRRREKDRDGERRDKDRERERRDKDRDGGRDKDRDREKRRDKDRGRDREREKDRDGRRIGVC